VERGKALGYRALVYPLEMRTEGHDSGNAVCLA
jgi:hypothetical protein